MSVCRGVSSSQFGDLEALCKSVMKEKQPFERLEVSKDTLLKMFKVGVRETSICYLCGTVNCFISFSLLFNQVGHGELPKKLK